MTKRMLVDATHPEETRVAVVSGNRLEELDFESASRKQLKGNIYLAKVTRVEPSLQAAFVEYGGNRHGFLAFSEVHPDYYRIPVADREALMAEERRQEEEAEARYEREERSLAEARSRREERSLAEAIQPDEMSERISPMPSPIDDEAESGDREAIDADPLADAAPDDDEDLPETAGDATPAGDGAENAGSDVQAETQVDTQNEPAPENPDVVGGDEAEEVHRRRPRPLRSYKIQEVIKRRQIMLVQVTKEERGNKGAALTTYLSLPGRYCVLMPNTGRGGGISRKITNPADRKRLKEILSELDIPDGMAVILRTAGLERSKQEIKRDLEYLLRLWDDIREQTLKSSAPCLIYEEANLIKRAIRDLYSSDIDEIWVEGDNGYRVAKDFMRMLMPSHTKRVQAYKEEAIPLFHRYQVETQIDAIHHPVVHLKSGGYIVINPTEALVAIDVNSGKSTRERNIEETAYKTNLEAAEEVARQLRLRDLAGLIVIDFIDMEEARNNASVERRLKEAMKTDRARIQLGRISAFGLLELSRQRLRPSLLETNFERCPHCAGTGVVRSVESAALHVLRAIEEEGIRKRSAEITVTVPTSIALYILNQKRIDLARIEYKYGFRVALLADDTLIAPDLRLERVKAKQPGDEGGPLVSAERILIETDRTLAAEAERDAAEDAAEDAEEAEEEVAEREAEGEGETEGRAENGDTAENGDRRRRRRRRRRGREGREMTEERTSADLVDAAAEAPETEADEGEDTGETESGEAETGEEAEGAEGDQQRKKRRRGKRGGRRRSRQRDGVMGENGELIEGEEGEGQGEGETGAEAPAQAPAPQPLPQPMATPIEAAPMEPIDFDWILAPPTEAQTTETPATEAPAPEAAAETPLTEAPAEEASATVAETMADEAPAEEAAPRKRAPRKRKTAEAAEAPAAAPAEAVAEAAPEAPAKAARKPRSRKKADTVVEAAAVADAEQAVEEAPKPKRRAPSRRKAAEPAEAPAATVSEAIVAETTPQADADTSVVAPADAGTAPSEAPSEAQTVETVENAAAKPAETVNPAPEKPKRGWWNR